MELKVRSIQESALSPDGRVKLGSLLAGVGQRAKLSDEEFGGFEQVRKKLPAHPLSFECACSTPRWCRSHCDRLPTGALLPREQQQQPVCPD